MGIAELDLQNNTLYLRAHIYFYGNEATDFLSYQIVQDINDQWNEAQGKVSIRQKEFDVIFEIQGHYAPTLQPLDIFENTDPLKNFFRIEKKAFGNISFVDGIGSNTGYFQLDNVLNHSTTAAHEFGHTIGLEHPIDLDLRGKGVPGIMYPRGTLTDPKFQYDPSIEAGKKGGTMNPQFRKVKQHDIDDLHLPLLPFNKDGKAVVGEFSSIWHEAYFD